MREKKELNFFWVALMYVGAIVGAGFASGREIWQFFGIFDSKGIVGVCVVGLLYVIFGLMISSIASVLRTSDMGKIIVPGGNPKLISSVGYLMAAMLFVVIVSMSAAGGALLKQQIGLPPAVGGLIVVILVVATVLGGFERMSKVFAMVMPLLIVAMIGVSVAVLILKPESSNIQAEAVLSPFAPNWIVAAMIYMSYNVLAMIPIVASSTRNAKSGKVGAAGSALGGIFLFVLILLICLAVMTDPGLSQSMDMPMLAFAAKFGPVANVIYTMVMIFAIYSAATANFYGVTTKIKEGKYKNIKVICLAMLGFGLGLVGFKNVVSYVLPMIGVIGLIIVTMVVVNFFKVIVFNFVTTQEKNRRNFPEGTYNMTAGRGGYALLVVGDEKTALIDCGMAYCGEQLVENIKNTIGDRPLDYLLMSHTHYDHIGALPILRETWPNMVTFGAEHGQKVLLREGALRGIKRLGDEAAKMYSGGKLDDVSIDGLTIDRVVHDGDKINLGDKEIVVLETPGHTRCSLSFVIEPLGMLVAAESVGVLERKGMCHPAILHSYEDAIASINKCRDYKPKRVVVSHYGIVPASYNETLWKMFENEAKNERNMIVDAYNSGMNEDEILEMMTDRYYCDYRTIEQPLEAFQINMINTIRLYIKDLEN